MLIWHGKYLEFEIWNLGRCPSILSFCVFYFLWQNNLKIWFLTKVKAHTAMNEWDLYQVQKSLYFSALRILFRQVISKLSRQQKTFLNLFNLFSLTVILYVSNWHEAWYWLENLHTSRKWRKSAKKLRKWIEIQLGYRCLWRHQWMW